jgi:hypothetical protein
MATMTYAVPGMCGEPRGQGASRGLGAACGAAGVEVDSDIELVTVTGERLVDRSLRAAIDKTGCEVA